MNSGKDTIAGKGHLDGIKRSRLFIICVQSNPVLFHCRVPSLEVDPSTPVVRPTSCSNAGTSTRPTGNRGTLGRLRSHVVKHAVDSVVMTEITHLLEAAAAGDRQAAAGLLPLVYDELRKLASARMAAERPGHTLDASALVHEAYLRLVGN